MTDNVTAAVPHPAAAPRRYTESLSLFVDPMTRAYTLGRAVELAKEQKWRTPRESEVIRAMIDDAVHRVQLDDPEGYARTVEIGRAEMERRKADQA